MMEMFQASIALSPEEAAQAEADAAAVEAAASTATEGSAEHGTMVEGGAVAPLSDFAGGATGCSRAGGGAVADTPTGVPCVLCGAAALLQRNSIIFCASSGCGFRLDTVGDALSADSLSAQGFRVVKSHNAICENAPGIFERHGVLFLECAECLMCEVLA